MFKNRLLYGFELTKAIQDTLYNLWFNQKILVFCRLDDYDENMIRENIKYGFNILDKNKVPFKIQNQILSLAQKGNSFEDYIRTLEVTS